MFSTLVVVLLALTPSFAFNFQLGQVQQCQPVFVSFPGNDISSTLPSQLLFIPFDGVPIHVQFPPKTTIASGLTVSSLPFLAGTTFLVTLQDSSGRSVSNTSDIITVLPSLNQDSTCLPMASVMVASPFLIADSLVQCENFTVKYNTSMVAQAPTVDLFNSRGPGLTLNCTSDDPASGTATYLLTFPQEKHVLFVFGSDAGLRSTPLLTVGGTSNSCEECLIKAGVMTASNPLSSNTSKNGTSISKTAIIASIVVASVVVVVCGCLIAFVVRFRRQQRHISDHPLEPAFDEKRFVLPLTSILMSPTSLEGVRNPLYTSEQFVSVFEPAENRTTIKSKRPSQSRRPNGTPSRCTSNSSDRITLDIEEMLNLASPELPMQSLRSSTSTSTTITRPVSRPRPLGGEARPGSAGPSPILDPTFQLASLASSHPPPPAPYHFMLRGRPDVPSGPGSTPSSMFIDPIAGRRSTLERVSTRLPLRPPRPPNVGLGSLLEVSPLRGEPF